MVTIPAVSVAKSDRQRGCSEERLRQHPDERLEASTSRPLSSTPSGAPADMMRGPSSIADSTVHRGLLHDDETRVWSDQAYGGQRERVCVGLPSTRFSVGRDQGACSDPSLTARMPAEDLGADFRVKPLPPAPHRARVERSTCKERRQKMNEQQNIAIAKKLLQGIGSGTDPSEIAALFVSDLTFEIQG